MNLINRVFEGYLNKFVIVFVDGTRVHLCTMEEHGLHLKIVLGKWRKKRLYAKFSKCKRWRERVTFVGQVVSKGRISVDPSRSRL